VFHISSEFSVASGVRRIEATTGLATLQLMEKNENLIARVAATLKTKPAELQDRAESVMGELRQLNQTVEKFKAKEAAGETDRLFDSAQELGGLKVLTAKVPGADAGKLRQMGDMIREKDSAVVAVLAAVAGEKITFLATCGKDAVQKGVKAGDIIRTITPICGGKGGGKPDTAMGGGSDTAKLDEALAAVAGFVSEKLK